MSRTFPKTEAEVVTRIAELQSEKENFRDQANKFIGSLEGQIQLFQLMLLELQSTTKADPPPLQQSEVKPQ